MECYYTQYEMKYMDDLLPGKTAERPEDKEMIIGKVRDQSLSVVLHCISRFVVKCGVCVFASYVCLFKKKCLKKFPFSCTFSFFKRVWKDTKIYK